MNLCEFNASLGRFSQGGKKIISVCVCPRRPTDGVTAPGTGVTGTFKSPKEGPGTLTPCCTTE